MQDQLALHALDLGGIGLHLEVDVMSLVLFSDDIGQQSDTHIILFGGAHWNSFFWMFDDWKFDSKLMYTCHRYGGEPTKEAIKEYIDFRDKSQLPMYMGEFGHNTDEWQTNFVQVLKEVNIGYTFWPYKKVDGSCMMRSEVFRDFSQYLSGVARGSS